MDIIINTTTVTGTLTADGVTINGTLTLGGSGTATIPPAFEQRVAELEEFKLNGTINGGLIF